MNIRDKSQDKAVNKSFDTEKRINGYACKLQASICTLYVLRITVIV